MMETEKVRNVIRDTRKDIKYVILAGRKLTRDEMLRQIRYYNYNSLNLKAKHGSEVVIESDI